jgi:hypothetical protein
MRGIKFGVHADFAHGRLQSFGARLAGFRAFKGFHGQQRRDVIEHRPVAHQQALRTGIEERLRQLRQPGSAAAPLSSLVKPWVAKCSVRAFGKSAPVYETIV